MKWLRKFLERKQARIFFALMIPFLAGFAAHPVAAQVAGKTSASVVPQDRLVEPDALNRELQADPQVALILQVGSKMLFDQAHIPGAKYAGPGSRPEGIASLRSRVAGLPRTQAIVIYCGCCPWDRCPNIGPAWQLLQQMGFTNARVLHIADNFGSDWVGKGYRAESSQ